MENLDFSESEKALIIQRLKNIEHLLRQCLQSEQPDCKEKSIEKNNY
ncbi:MAG: hypothetical protein K9I29_04985 [Bacteroidales bacterium]|nr:hypothetical protein [Bacteroidales bacterium]MCF8327628.1 hypothetical protein [Bacteroidales bacterium]